MGVKTFSSLNEMMAYLRGKDVEVDHLAVKVESVKPIEEKPKKKAAKKATKKKESK